MNTIQLNKWKTFIEMLFEMTEALINNKYNATLRHHTINHPASVRKRKKTTTTGMR